MSAQSGASAGPAAGTAYEPPRIPASAGALILDPLERVLILKPTYKKGWTIPGGQIDVGESPWTACRRETREECGLEVQHGRLVCVDFRPARPRQLHPPRAERAGGVRFLFHCGTFSERELAEIRLQDSEIEDYRLAGIGEAATLLSGPIRRRVRAAIAARHCVYLEDGRPVDGVGA